MEKAKMVTKLTVFIKINKFYRNSNKSLGNKVETDSVTNF